MSITTPVTAERLVELPRVNLLPPEILQRRQLQRTQAGLGLVVLVALVGVGLVYTSGGSAVTDAKSRLHAAQTTQVGLQSQVAKLSYVTAQQAQAVQAKDMLTQATASTISFSAYLADLGVITPKNVWFTSITLSSTIPPGSLTTAAQAPPKVGTVTFAGLGAVGHDAVADWLDSAAKEPGFANLYFSNSTESVVPGTGTIPGTVPKIWVTFASSADLTSAALCGTESGKC